MKRSVTQSATQLINQCTQVKYYLNNESQSPTLGTLVQFGKLFLLCLFSRIVSFQKVSTPNRLTRLYQNPLANDPNSTVVHAGIVDKILLGILSDKLNFTQVTSYCRIQFDFINDLGSLLRYDIRRPLDTLSAGLLLRNGSWTGSTGQLQRKVMPASTFSPYVMILRSSCYI